MLQRKILSCSRSTTDLRLLQSEEFAFNSSLRRRTLTMIVGPVVAGKSTLIEHLGRCAVHLGGGPRPRPDCVRGTAGHRLNASLRDGSLFRTNMDCVRYAAGAQRKLVGAGPGAPAAVGPDRKGDQPEQQSEAAGQRCRPRAPRRPSVSPGSPCGQARLLQGPPTITFRNTAELAGLIYSSAFTQPP